MKKNGNEGKVIQFPRIKRPQSDADLSEPAPNNLVELNAPKERPLNMRSVLARGEIDYVQMRLSEEEKQKFSALQILEHAISLLSEDAKAQIDLKRAQIASKSSNELERMFWSMSRRPQIKSNLVDISIMLDELERLGFFNISSS